MNWKSLITARSLQQKIINKGDLKKVGDLLNHHMSFLFCLISDHNT